MHQLELRVKELRARAVRLVPLPALRQQELQQPERAQLRQRRLLQQAPLLPRQQPGSHLQLAALGAQRQQGLARHPIAAEVRLVIVAAKMTAGSTCPWAMSARSIRLAEQELVALELPERRPIALEESSPVLPIVVAAQRSVLVAQ